MKLKIAALAFLLLAPCSAFAQTACQYIAYGAVLTAAQWNSCFSAKQDVLGYTPVNRNGDTMQGELRLVPSSIAGAGINLGQGAASLTPANGDLWITSAGLFAQVGGVTIGPFGSGSGSVTSVAVATQNGVSAVVTNPTGAASLAFTLGAITPTSVNGNSVPVASDTVALLAASQAFTNKTYNGATITSTNGTLTLASGKTLTVNNSIALAGTDGKTLTVSNNLGLAGTDGTTMTFPGASDTLAGLGTAESFSKGQSGGQSTPAISTATFTPDLNAGNHFFINLTSACPCTLASPSNVASRPGSSGVITVTQDGSGSRTITTYGSVYKFPSGTKPTFSTAAGAVDDLTYYVRDATHIDVGVFGLAFQ